MYGGWLANVCDIYSKVIVFLEQTVFVNFFKLQPILLLYISSKTYSLR